MQPKLAFTNVYKPYSLKLFSAKKLLPDNVTSSGDGTFAVQLPNKGKVQLYSRVIDDATTRRLSMLVNISEKRNRVICTTHSKTTA